MRFMTFDRHLPAAVLTAVALTLTGCGAAGDADHVAQSAADPPATASDPGDQHASAHADVTSGRPAAAVQPADAAELRITLEKLLGQHATLAIRLMRGRVDGTEQFTQAALDAVVSNTEQLTEAVGSVYGTEGAATFEDLWSGHVTSLFDYAVAVAEEDTDAMHQAQTELESYMEDFGAFVETATDGELDAADVAGGLNQHIDMLLRQIDAYAAGDYDAAFDLQREAYTHMFPTGRALSEGIAAHHPGELPLPVEDAPNELRSALGALLGAHVELAIDAMRAGVTGEPYFEQAAAALNANTADLTEAMGALFGAEDAERFNTLWADHIDAFVQYTAATAEDDDDARQAALHDLHEFHPALGQHLSDMTGGELPAETAAEVLRVHDEQLIEQIEAYAAEDYETAYQISFDAYQHVFDTAAALAAAIEAHVGPQLPVGGAQTGGGGTAGDRHAVDVEEAAAR